MGDKQLSAKQHQTFPRTWSLWEKDSHRYPDVMETDNGWWAEEQSEEVYLAEQEPDDA
jgi:hypothetical protein